MGGDVDIKSEVGKGTSIQLTLRRSIANTQTEAEAQAAAESGHAERILVVDDDHDVRGLMTSFLSEIGYVVHEADDGKAALALQRTVNPQLMIIDFSMPGTNGAEVVKAARASPADAARPLRQRLCGFRGAGGRDGIRPIPAQTIPPGRAGLGGSQCARCREARHALMAAWRPGYARARPLALADGVTVELLLFRRRLVRR